MIQTSLGRMRSEVLQVHLGLIMLSFPCHFSRAVALSTPWEVEGAALRNWRTLMPRHNLMRLQRMGLSSSLPPIHLQVTGKSLD